MSDQQVTYALRALREGAKVGVREMARRLGISPNSYTHYENPNRFKDPYLPMHWAERFADALEPDGVPRDAVLALAGVSDVPSEESLDARLSKLPADRRQRVLQYLADQEALHERENPARDADTKEAGQ
ncbi:helix-turn-helix domain-containing protein [Paracoccus denitrificans]|jgi:transcriptional regulator with XRE-family HTH domain|nr:helix-turn-helix transcriptional regulator [Paracoccus denitrificans]MBB4628088.1 transcriptional regulator with XRE-family HTH domain [Paracoccus denitrificans]MCU7429154.1 helix-turn-helix domain-containing protein [Paracoccus denitrificans]UPV96534.1 helix-turn-helix domain-containing protein [Paracoccus denitrificans]WQO36059.1 helix-turn-helix transcriptional regulator [Paracoccus denitrificans]GEK69260.1 hypothetical protein PDE01_27800 [Paracoccus denitrificans]